MIYYVLAVDVHGGGATGVLSIFSSATRGLLWETLAQKGFRKLISSLKQLQRWVL